MGTSIALIENDCLWHADLLLPQHTHRPPVVLPLERLFEPAGMVVRKAARRLDGRPHIPGPLGVQPYDCFSSPRGMHTLARAAATKTTVNTTWQS